MSVGMGGADVLFTARLPWGERLYPDSLVVAAEIPIFRRLRNDPRLDTASVIAQRDTLPPSSGD